MPESPIELQRESTRKARKTEVEKLLEEQGPAPTSRLRPRQGRFKGMIAGMIATLGNQVALSTAVMTMGSTEAYVTLQGFDAVTETFDYLECHTYSALMANKTKGQKGMGPDFPTYQQAICGPDSDE